ncbi:MULTISPECIES: hypothetical protein [unclassified Bradyrhizobium]|uniref:hypothetical protein n=1 Tax=unclassified Bradyrhizobium TaxID=2631580 RepID=UPI002FF41B3C
MSNFLPRWLYRLAFRLPPWQFRLIFRLWWNWHHRLCAPLVGRRTNQDREALGELDSGLDRLARDYRGDRSAALARRD